MPINTSTAHAVIYDGMPIVQSLPLDLPLYCGGIAELVSLEDYMLCAGKRSTFYL